MRLQYKVNSKEKETKFMNRVTMIIQMPSDNSMKKI